MPATWSTRAILATYPDDLEAATLHAEALMDLSPWYYWTQEGAPCLAELPRQDWTNRKPYMDINRKRNQHREHQPVQDQPKRIGGIARKEIAAQHTAQAEPEAGDQRRTG